MRSNRPGLKIGLAGVIYIVRYGWYTPPLLVNEKTEVQVLPCADRVTAAASTDNWARLGGVLWLRCRAEMFLDRT